jgi:hypothetical protein
MKHDIYEMEVTTTSRSVHRVRATSKEQAAEIARSANKLGGFRAERKVSRCIEVREIKP